MRHDRAHQLSSRIRRACPEARVLVVCDGDEAGVFVSLAGRTARIERLRDWRAHYRRGRDRNWFVSEAVEATSV
jgi:hypothetical protein